MEELRIATPPRAARAKKKHHLPQEKKKKGRVAEFFSAAFGLKDPVKQEAELKGLGEDDDDDDDGSQAGSTVAQEEAETGPGRPTLLARLKNRAKKYLKKDGEEELPWDGNGVPPWVERGSSVAWSEDKSRAASEYGDNLVDFLANPRRLLSEPPVFFDPVEDRVRSRWLPVFALCSFPAILATVLLLDIWDKSTVFMLDERPVLNTLFRSGDPMMLNMLPATNMSLKVQALNRHGYPLKHLLIKTHVIDWELSPNVVRDLPFCSRTLAVEGGSMCPVCKHALSGTSAQTDDDGVATFSELAFEAGLPGAYRLEFYAAQVLLNVTEWITVKAVVSQLVVDDSYTADRSGGQDLVFNDKEGLPLRLASTPPAVRIVLASGVKGLATNRSRGTGPLLLSNLSAHAIHLDAAWHLGGALANHIRLSDNPEVAGVPNTQVALVGSQAAVDGSGVASFPDLAVAGYDRPYLLLAFVCQGRVLVWSRSDPPASYNLSEYAAASGGRGAMPTLAYVRLPSVSSALMQAARRVKPLGVEGKFQVTEGVLFGLEMQHDASLAGGALVAKMRATRATGVDASAADVLAREAGQVLAMPAYHKLLLGYPPAILLSASGSSAGLFRVSLFGKPGTYKLDVFFMGTVVHTLDLAVEMAVAMLTPGELPDSPVLCGVKLAPVCRHNNGECSFGQVAGSTQVGVAAGLVCDGILLLSEYVSAGDGVLPWALFEGKAAADGLGRIATSAKLLSLEMVPWGSDIAGWAANPELASAPAPNATTPAPSTPAPSSRFVYSADALEEWDVVSASRAEQLSGRYGSGKISRLQVLVVPAGVSFLQPVLRVDTQLFPVPIKVKVTSHISKGATNCGVRACTWIRTEVGLPDQVLAGHAVTPPPRAKLVDGHGAALADRVVCLVYGTAAQVEQASASTTSSTDVWRVAYQNFLCVQGGLPPSQCSSVPAAIQSMGCAVTDSQGLATLTNVRLRSDAELMESMSIWRFVAVNAFPERQVSCLNTYSAWISMCRGALRSVQVINSIQRIEVPSGAGIVTGLVAGQRSVQVESNSSRYGHVSGTTLEVPLRCHGNASAGLVACADVTVKLLRFWNSRLQQAVSVTRQSLVVAADGSGLLTFALDTRLSGIYLMELESNGARDQLFVRMRHDARSIKQLWDRRAVRDGNYTKCTFDCNARNVSNIGRLHPQDMRALVANAKGLPLYGAQVWAELVGAAAGLKGQLSGSISEEQALVLDHATQNPPNFTGAVLSRLAIAAAIPGTYRFRLHVFNPAPLAPAADPAPVLTHEFYVKDYVVASIEKHPPVRTAGGETRPASGQTPAAVLGEMEVMKVGVEVVRWKGHTSFMYADLWVPPVLHVEVAGVGVSGSENGVEVGDQEHVLVSLQGLHVGSYRPTERVASLTSGLPTETAHVSIQGRVQPLAFGRYCLAVGGDGLARSNRSRDDSDTLWLPEGTTGSINVAAASVSASVSVEVRAGATSAGPDAAMCSRAFAVSERVYGLVVLGDYPLQIGQGEEFDVEVRATLASGEPLEGVVIEAELAHVGCSLSVVSPFAAAPNASDDDVAWADCASNESAMEFKGTSGVVDVLRREQVVVNTMWTTRVMLRTATGHALKGSVGVTNANGVAVVPVLMGRARAGLYRLRFRSGATVTHPTDVIRVTSVVRGIKILEPMVGISDRAWFGKKPLGPYDFSASAAGGSILVDGFHSVTGDLSSESTLNKPDVQVVDAYGSAVKRDSQVTLHVVTCGRKWMPNGTITFPPPVGSDCEEFLDFVLGDIPLWVCRTAGKCDTGFTRFRQIQFKETTPSGWYFVFFASDGFVVEQQEPLYVQNLKLPADTSMLSYRMFILFGLAGLPLVFNANLINRSRVWLQISLAGMAFFSLATVLYMDATIASYGSPRKVQRELVMCGALMVASVGSVGVILLRLVFQPDSMQYFTARQNKYLKAMQAMLVAPREAVQQTAGSGRRAPGVVSSGNRVYPDTATSPAKRQYKAAAAEGDGAGQDVAAGSSPKSSARSEGSHKALLAGRNFGMGRFGKAAGAGQGAAAAADGAGAERETGAEAEASAGGGAAVEAGANGAASAPKVRGGRRGKPAPGSAAHMAQGGGGQKRAPASGSRMPARIKSVASGGKRSSARTNGGSWCLPLPSLRGIMLVRSKEGRAELSDYWEKKMEEVINVLTGARAQAGESGQVQEGFQYPMRLLAGLALSLIGLCIMLVGFESAHRRTRFGLERLRAEVVRYRVALGNFDTSIDLPQEKAALPAPPYSDTYDIVALTYTVMESLYGSGHELFAGLLAALEMGATVGNFCVIGAWLWSSVQTLRKYRQKMLELRADRTLVNHWKFPIHEAAGYPGRQLWASLASGVLVWLPTALLVALFMWGPSSRFFLLYIALPIGGLSLIELASLLVRRSFNAMACSGPYIKNRTIFGIYDFIGLYAHFVSGAALAVSRFVLTYVDFAVNFARLDLPVVEGSRQHWDAGHSSYMAMLYLDFFYNAPITSTLAYNLAAAMFNRREIKEMSDADMSHKGHQMREKGRVAMVQRNRWHMLFTMDRNNHVLSKYRVHAPPPPNTWDVDDDVLDVESMDGEGTEEMNSDDELKRTPR